MGQDCSACCNLNQHEVNNEPHQITSNYPKAQRNHTSNESKPLATTYTNNASVYM